MTCSAGRWLASATTGKSAQIFPVGANERFLLGTAPAPTQSSFEARKGSHLRMTQRACCQYPIVAAIAECYSPLRNDVELPPLSPHNGFAVIAGGASLFGEPRRMTCSAGRWPASATTRKSAQICPAGANESFLLGTAPALDLAFDGNPIRNPIEIFRPDEDDGSS
jgi:hypothetical protein